jgi:hypothetical protein
MVSLDALLLDTCTCRNCARGIVVLNCAFLILINQNTYKLRVSNELWRLRNVLEAPIIDVGLQPRSARGILLDALVRCHLVTQIIPDWCRSCGLGEHLLLLGYNRRSSSSNDIWNLLPLLRWWSILLAYLIDQLEILLNWNLAWGVTSFTWKTVVYNECRLIDIQMVLGTQLGLKLLNWSIITP